MKIRFPWLFDGFPICVCEHSNILNARDTRDVGLFVHVFEQVAFVEKTLLGMSLTIIP